MTEPEQYTCARCGGTFGKTRSDDEAMAEAREDWGDVDLAVVCDDCYGAFMQWMRTQGDDPAAG